MVDLSPRLARRAQGYAAKFAAETISYEPPRYPGATDANFATTFAWCVRVPDASEYPAIRAALAREWPDALIRVWCRDGVWHAAVPLAEAADAHAPETVERMRARAAEAIGRVTGGAHGEVVPWGRTIVGGPEGEEWHITPARDPREYLFADSPRQF